eukprot:GHVL01015443.1.p1 GENE.GHVL01015443.1~~GHVL01015443.1.p1  ORF type:complete len:255 (+),score=20.12 GHVL01015443.1:271-1035(+)
MSVKKNKYACFLDQDKSIHSHNKYSSFPHKKQNISRKSTHHSCTLDIGKPINNLNTSYINPRSSIHSINLSSTDNNTSEIKVTPIDDTIDAECISHASDDLIQDLPSPLPCDLDDNVEKGENSSDDDAESTLSDSDDESIANYIHNRRPRKTKPYLWRRHTNMDMTLRSFEKMLIRSFFQNVNFCDYKYAKNPKKEDEIKLQHFYLCELFNKKNKFDKNVFLTNLHANICVLAYPRMKEDAITKLIYNQNLKTI